MHMPISKASTSACQSKSVSGAINIAGRAFLARSSRQIDATLVVGVHTVQLVASDDAVLLEFPKQDLNFDAQLGSADRRATLPDGTLFETGDHIAVKLVTGDDLGAKLNRAERFGPRLLWVVAASLAGVFAIWKFALPALVWVAVVMTPEPLRDGIDAGSLQVMDRIFSKPSALSDARKKETQDIFDTLAAQVPESEKRGLHLNFRSMPGLGPNAMALPGGTIVVTDTLINMFADDPDVIAAVIGHEMGHVIEDHGLTQLYRSLGIYVLVALIAGDTGPILEDILLEGGVILSLSFSREHEASADRFGLRLANETGYDPAGLMRFFEVLPDADETETGWKSTHPSSGARIKAIEEFIQQN